MYKSYMTERLFVVDAVYRQSVRFLIEALGEHCIGNFLEARKVCTGDQIVVHAVRVEGVADLMVNACHDGFEFCIDFDCRPCDAFAVLSHLKT